MGLIGNIQCGIGIHDWTDWEYSRREDRDCTQHRTCRRCENRSESRTEHIPLNWRYARESGDCISIRSCSRCLQVVDHRTEHSLGQSEPTSESPCVFVRRCSRCPYVAKRSDHVGDGWRYAGPKTCDQIQICRRCLLKEEKPAENAADHDAWTDWDYAYKGICNLFKRQCKRCGKEALKHGSIEHQMGNWEPISETTEQRTCSRCGHRERKSQAQR